jgi:lipoate-protein ligase A
MNNQWQLIVEAKPLRGSWNMAADEFLFSSLSAEPRTVIRFYQWERPTASLGYTQGVEKTIDLDYCRRHGIDVVRRMTGGKLVLHDREITYSVASSDCGTFTSTLAGSYRAISQALILGLSKMDLEARLAGMAPKSYTKGTLPCFSFAARDEIEVAGKKIVGSAQKRSGVKFLQHGSIPLAHDERLLKAISLLKENTSEIRMTSLGEALGHAADFGWAVKRLIAGFEEFFKVKLNLLALSEADFERIRAIEIRKYANPSWTLRGRE